MVTPEEYWKLPYSSKPDGWITLKEEELEHMSLTQCYEIMNNEDYTKSTRTKAAIFVLYKDSDD